MGSLSGEMLEALDELIRQVGPLGYLVLALAAMIEYVFPPFPGDMLTLFGGVYAARGQKPWGWVLLAVTCGSVAGASLDYAAGRYLARLIDAHPERPLPFGLSRERLHDLQRRMRERGAVLLLLNRFIPAVRSLIFVAAGASAMPFTRVLVLGAVSAATWNLVLLAAGLAVGGNVERLLALASTYRTFVISGVALAAAALLLRALLRRPRRAVAAPPSPSQPPVAGGDP